MDFKELKTFLTLSQTMSYQKAAELLNFAPSTLNRHIQLLEEELGTKLFAKRGRWLEMTQDGQAFIEYARRMLTVYEEAINNLGLPADRDESICIGGCEITLAHSMLDMLSAFTRSHPHTRLAMLTSPNARVPEMVRSGAVDIGYYYTMEPELVPGVQDVVLNEEPLCLCVAPNHPLASRKALRYEDLQGVSFAFPHDDCCSAVTILRTLRENRVQIDRISYLGAMQIMIEQVLQHHALLSVPASAADHFARVWGLKTLDMDEPPFSMWLHVLCREDSSMFAKNLLHYSTDYPHIPAGR